METIVDDKVVDDKVEDENIYALKTELKELESKYLKLEQKLNETITMTNQLILNVNGANQFICGLHNALYKAGLIASPAEIKKEADKLLETQTKEPEPEPMPEVN
jgi:hypothetical protein